MTLTMQKNTKLMEQTPISCNNSMERVNYFGSGVASSTTSAPVFTRGGIATNMTRELLSKASFGMNSMLGGSVAEIMKENLRLKQELMLRRQKEEQRALSPTIGKSSPSSDSGRGGTFAQISPSSVITPFDFEGLALKPPLPVEEKAKKPIRATPEIELSNVNMKQQKSYRSLCLPYKVYQMLEDAERNDQESIISYLPNDQGFRVHDPEIFTQDIMPHFFSSDKLSTFYRQLNLYGFKRIGQGPYTGGFYHPQLKRNQKQLLVNIKRKKQSVPQGDSNPKSNRNAVLKAMSVVERNRHLLQTKN